MSAMESATMFEIIALMQAPVLSACSSFELSCFTAGVFFSAVYIVALSLWFAAGH